MERVKEVSEFNFEGQIRGRQKKNQSEKIIYKGPSYRKQVIHSVRLEPWALLQAWPERCTRGTSCSEVGTIFCRQWKSIKGFYVVEWHDTVWIITKFPFLHFRKYLLSTAFWTLCSPLRIRLDPFSFLLSHTIKFRWNFWWKIWRPSGRIYT